MKGGSLSLKLAGLGGPKAPATFVGRQPLLDNMARLLGPGDAVKFCVLSGPAAMGKSATAARLAQMMADTFQPVWLRFGTNPRDAWIQIANAMGLRLAAADPRTGTPPWFVETQERLRASTNLIVIDDLGQTSASEVLRWLPQPGPGHCAVLLVSERPMPLVQRECKAARLDLQPLTDQEQLELQGFLADEFPMNQPPNVNLIKLAEGYPSRIRSIYWREHRRVSPDQTIEHLQRDYTIDALRTIQCDPLPITVLAECLSNLANLETWLAYYSEAGFVERDEDAVRLNPASAKMLSLSAPSAHMFISVMSANYRIVVANHMEASQASKDDFAERRLLPHLRRALRAVIDERVEARAQTARNLGPTFEQEKPLVRRMVALLEQCTSGDPAENSADAVRVRSVAL